MADRAKPCAEIPSASNTSRSAAAAGANAPVPFAYPPVDPGLPVIGLDEILDAHRDLLARIKLCYGNDPQSFQQDILVLVRRYAALVHLLPATPANYFNEPGGLFRIGLETAFYALQGTDAHIFSGRATIAVRRHLEPRWRLATFIAGLCAEIHRTLGQVIVTDRDGTEWPAYLQGLYPWLTARDMKCFFLKWLPNAPQSAGLALFSLPMVVPASMLQHLAQGNAVVVPHLLASLSGMPLAREHNILDELVRKSAALVIDRFLQNSADRSGKPVLGSHLERYLLDALRRLIATHPAWTPNAERSRVWYGTDGLFIVWPNAAADVRKLLEADQLPGIPKSPETMLEILLGASVLQAQPDGKPLWLIQPPGAKLAIEAVKLIEPAVVLTNIEHRPAPVAIALLVPSDACAGAAPAPAPSSATVSEADSPQSAEQPPRVIDKQPGSDRAPFTAHSGQQLQLQVSSTSSAEPEHPPSAKSSVLEAWPTDADPPTRAKEAPVYPLRLEAPMRLASRLRTAIADIVQELNACGEQTCACANAEGLFIALAEFERRHIEPSHALRGLSDARMLAHGSHGATGTKTCTVRGQEYLGLLIAPAFLSGLLSGDPGTASR